MRVSLSFFFLLTFGLSATCQNVEYRTIKAGLKISAFKDGEHFDWENKNITVVLDYRTGEFTTRLHNSDFVRVNEQNFGEQQNTGEQTDREYVLKGILPIHEITDQANISQTYPVELQLICDPLRLDKTLGFEMTVTRTSSNPGSYRIFKLHGRLFNDEVQLPAFEGFDNEIELWIMFNAVSNAR